MRLVAIETSTEYCSCALLIDGHVVEHHVLAGQSHSDLLLPAVKRLMDEAGLAFSALDAIAFGAGPGSFTGLRIACGVAQGLAFAHNLPVVPVVSLESLAEQEHDKSGADAVITAFDARMGELYLAAYQREVGEAEGWHTVIAPQLVTAPVIDTRLPGLPAAAWHGAGSGFGSHGAVLTARYVPVQVDAQCVPRAAAIATLAARKFARGETVPADHAAPLYLRDKVALDVREQAALRERQRALREAVA